MGLLPPDHVYSYTQLTSVSECPFSFYLARIERDENGEKLKESSNAFAEYGTLIHDILDKWGKGELKAEELALEYDLRFEDEVVTQFSRMLKGKDGKSYRDQVYEDGRYYLASFNGFDGMKVISSEEKFETDIDGRRFVGVIDMVLEDENTGGLVILDHKSKSLTAFKKAEKEMYRQQLLYSKYVNEKYGKYPETLAFNLFKVNGLIKSKPFTTEEYEEALEWARQMINRIETFDVLDFMETKESDFYCNEICGMRKYCPNGVYRPKK